MRTVKLAIGLMGLCVIVGACHRDKDVATAPEPEAPAPIVAPEGFAHEPAWDVAGYYLPAGNIQVGDYRLNHIAMGALSDFDQWEAGERQAVFGPIIVDFDDVTSPKTVNELGGEGYEKTIRLKPQSFRLYPGEVSFSSSDPALGPVLFEGKFNKAAYDEAKATGSSGPVAVLTGDLQIGDQRFDNVVFTYWAGD